MTVLCPFCQRTLANNSSFRTHKYNFHRQTTQTTSQESSSDIQESIKNLELQAKKLVEGISNIYEQFQKKRIVAILE